MSLKRLSLLRLAATTILLLQPPNYLFALPQRPSPKAIYRVERVIEKLSTIRDMENRAQKWEYGTVAVEDGRFLQIMTQALRAQNVLEIGTGIGFSSLYIGLGLLRTGGRLTTIEISPRLARMARENVKAAGLQGVITVIDGDALKVIPTLRTRFDLVFSDALKMDNVLYFDLFMPLVNEGGIIMAHDTNVGGSQAKKMRDYIDMLKVHPCLDSVLTGDETFPHPIGISGPGIAVSYKRCSDLDGTPWNWTFAKSSSYAQLRSSEESGLAYEMLEEYEDDFGNSRLLLLVNERASKKEIIQLCKALLQKYSHQDDFTIHIYNKREAFEKRDVLRHPPNKYFKHLIARVWRHRNAQNDEIQYFPDGLYLLLPKKKI